MSKENYSLRATFIVEDVQVPDVLCKIYLPERVCEKPRMKLRPTKEQFDKLTRSHKGSFKAEIKDRDGIIRERLEAPVVYFENMNTTYWEEGISDSSIDGEPQDLTVAHFLTSASDDENSSVVFWLSPNEMLSPVMICENSYDGSIKVERVLSYEFSLGDNIKLIFDKHFRSQETDNKDTIRWSFLVSCAELEIPAHDIQKIRVEVLPKIDDFLLISSLASRTRTACLGFQSTNQNVHSKYYRGDFSFPTGASEASFDQGLVWKKDFEEFATHCYMNFSKYPNKNALRRAIWALVPGKPQVLEERFLSLFAGVETLLLEYRRQENLEFVFEHDVWKQIKEQIRKSIKGISNSKLEKEQRSFMYRKVDELNRISLRDVFNHFCKRYNLDLTDLWPVFADQDQVGLSDVRNRLIHGETFANQCYDAVWVACENLKWILERLILKILDWPIDKTEVEAGFLKRNAHPLAIMPAQQEKIAQIFYNS